MTASTALKTRVAVGRPRLATAGFTTNVRMCLGVDTRYDLVFNFMRMINHAGGGYTADDDDQDDGWPPKSKKGHDEDQGLGGFPVPSIVVHRRSLLQLQDHNLQMWCVVAIKSNTN